MDNIEKIKELLQNNNGILLVKEAQKNDIHRQYIKQLEETGYLKKVSKGVYAEKDKEINEFFILGQKYKKGIFSHNTALYFYDLTDRTPIRIDMTLRIRDYYDVYMLINTQSKIIDKKTLKDAITLTAQYRGTSEIIKDWKKIVEKIANDSKMRQQWKRYQKDNFYAEEIEYNDLINAISNVSEIFDN